ncbi:MAG: hypothetical protein V7L11_01605 [Nostoc sp.]|uniref:hypothetical protein n=1 Tax=Nostoc sp. TaxID=1180 RepID=UPI002FF83B6C
MGTRDWGLGTGDWGLGDEGAGETGGEINNTQCPIPNAQSPIKSLSFSGGASCLNQLFKELRCRKRVGLQRSHFHLLQ